MMSNKEDRGTTQKRRGATEWEGDEAWRLFGDLLDRALTTFLTRAGGSEAPSVAAAEAWIMADDHDSPFSFINVCRLLDLSPGRIRSDLVEARLSLDAPTSPSAWSSKIRTPVPEMMISMKSLRQRTGGRS